MERIIELDSIGKRYPISNTKGFRVSSNFKDFWALKDVSLEVYIGEIVGIVGRNGAGKTTLLNIIAGTLSSTEGKILTNGKILGLFNLGIGFQDELTGRDNIFLNGVILGASREELNSKLQSIIDFSELGDFINMPLGSYSQGMRLRLGFGIVASLDFDILVIDEVLAVGDVLFQSKCFERLMDFKRSGKTLVITNQSMDLIERFCDRVALLEHGKLLFCGSASEGISRYRNLLNSKPFYVGPPDRNNLLVENTKKWSEDMCDWGKKLGTKEAIIETVEFIDRFGQRCNRIKTREPLKIRVNFTTKNNIKEPHFGIAIFRKDGVYCYGPNTAFEGFYIPEIKSGRGMFVLNYKELLLAPGEYKVSVAIWDKNEVLAYDYHNGYYTLIVKGFNERENGLLNMPFNFDSGNLIDRVFCLRRKYKFCPDLSLLADRWGKRNEAKGIEIESVKLLNFYGEEKNVFMTNETVKLCINFRHLEVRDRDSCLWIGLYRDDGVYCQGISVPFGKRKTFCIRFSKFRLLPGGYRFSFGVWNNLKQNFLFYHHAIYSFKMVFDHQDHGTIYLEHKWQIGG